MRKYLAAAAAAMMAAGPCLAAEIPAMQEHGARQSGAVAAAYFKVPLGGAKRTQKAQGGLRLAMTHDYRSAGAQTARVINTEGFDLRLVGEKKPSLYVAGQKLDAEQNRHNLGGPSGTVVIVLVAVVAVGGFFLARAISDSGGE